MAAAKEAVPFLAKLAVCVLVVLIGIPMLVFACLPNMFFGFSSSGESSVSRMTTQAMTLGGIYVGNGYAVEAMGTKYGVVRTEVAGRGWQGWCRIPYIEYREAG